jgi:hypothetical protein
MINMTEYLFSQNRDKKNEESTSYYTMSDHQEYFDEDQMPRLKTNSDKVYAKKIINEEGKAKYSIRLSLSNKLFNPLSPFGLDKTKSFLDNTVRNENRFCNVNYKAFSLYLDFLKTKNLSYLYNAERENE